MVTCIKECWKNLYRWRKCLELFLSSGLNLQGWHLQNKAALFFFCNFSLYWSVNSASFNQFSKQNHAMTDGIMKKKKKEAILLYFYQNFLELLWEIKFMNFEVLCLI